MERPGRRPHSTQPRLLDQRIDLLLEPTLVVDVARPIQERAVESHPRHGDEAVDETERGARTGASVALIVSNTFAPGPRDSRKLGVQVDRIAVSPVGGVALPPRRALAGASVAGLTQGAAFGIVGFTAAAAAGAAVLMGALIAVPISLGLGPYSEFPIAAAWIAFWVAAGLVAVRAIAAPSNAASLVGPVPRTPISA